ncbi:hypothetical protein NKJ88_01070 [Mesorhizobium sp. M0016]|uniref:glycosyltransferase n=1 Tax=Mesorhizobium sp. M0016 TaxID=2956843 RepID=UPI00333C05EA
MRSCFLLAADKEYFPYACLAMRRILDVSASGTPGFLFHLGGIDSSDMFVGNRLLGDGVEIVDVSTFMAEAGSKFRKSSPAAFIRLFADRLPQFHSFDRIAYADCDVLFNRDIADLAGQDMHAPLLAAHDDYMYFRPRYRSTLGLRPGAPYFNSGVVVFNMPLVREQGLLSRSRQVAIERQCNDQNAMNIAFDGAWQTMHPNWNLMSKRTRKHRFSGAYCRHFAGGKPWGNQVGVESDALAVWRDLAKETPWGAPFRQRIPFERGLTKRILQKFDGLAGAVLGNELYKRRARYDGDKMYGIYAEHAEAGLMAVSYPEELGGFGLPPKPRS